MKAIIAYASAGAGHYKAAEAIYDYLKEKPEYTDVKLVDILKQANPLFKNIYVRGYLFLINYALWLWGFLFWVTSRRAIRHLYNNLGFFINRLGTAEFSGFLIREQPDIIISTHFLPPEIAYYLKKKNKIKSRIVTAITDFGVHPFWLSGGTDSYIVASHFTGEQLLKYRIGHAAIKECGIPVGAKFLQKYDKTGLRQKIGIIKGVFTVLITTGSSAIGNVEKIVQALRQDAQLMVICAKNKKLYKKLSAKNYPGVKIFGYVDNIQELMAASDIVIAKPGGLTTSEIINMELVPVFVWPIPGQETGNIEAMRKYGIDNFARGLKELKKIILDYRDNPDKLEKTKELIKNIKLSSGLDKFYNALR